MKIHPVGAKKFHVDRRTNGKTDMLKLKAAFCNFANVPKVRWEGGLVGVDIGNIGTKWKTAISCIIFLYFLVPNGKMSNDSHCDDKNSLSQLGNRAWSSQLPVTSPLYRLKYSNYFRIEGAYCHKMD